MSLKPDVEMILKKNKADLQNNIYITTLKDGLAEGFLSDVLAALNHTPANIPTEVLTQILKEYYIDNNSNLSAEEKAEKSEFIQYLINQYQISIFESIMNSKQK